jgi:hypothetical protein
MLEKPVSVYAERDFVIALFIGVPVAKPFQALVSNLDFNAAPFKAAYFPVKNYRRCEGVVEGNQLAGIIQNP